MNEIVFDVTQEADGGFAAECLAEAIFTEADSWDELRANVLEAATLHFEDGPVQPRLIQLHYVKDDLICQRSGRRTCLQTAWMCKQSKSGLWPNSKDDKFDLPARLPRNEESSGRQ